MKEHKFFERFLENDLEKLSEFINIKNNQLMNGELPGISKEMIIEAEKEYSCVPTIMLEHYNIFQFTNEYIYNLYNSVKEMTIEACQYYNIDFKKQKYYIQGWFNFDYQEKDMGDQDLHDHCGGTGAPFFHGYYCVNAQPSVTHYQINRKTMFNNINKNNRAILSETGHPHRKGGWYGDKPRITIAYDMMPLESLVDRNVINQIGRAHV